MKVQKKAWDLLLMLFFSGNTIPLLPRFLSTQQKNHGAVLGWTVSIPRIPFPKW